jgi:lipoprotein NlpI
MIAPMRPERRKLLLPQLAIVWILGLTAMAPAAQAPEPSNDPDVVFNQAIRDFFSGNIKTSADGFDQLVERGIVLYYAERYDDCRKQFESHRTYNPNDVENAAWHFLCVSRLESPEQAKLELLPVGPDSRRPMQEVYGLFAGELTANEVLAATKGELSAEFFANLYLGLHAEALGNNQAAIDYLQMAADDKYARVGGYMHMVARVHLSLRSASR